MVCPQLQLATRIEVEGTGPRRPLPCGCLYRLTIGAAANLKPDARVQSRDRLPMQTLAAGAGRDLDGGGNIVSLVPAVVDVTGVHHGVQMHANGGDVVGPL